ncbi:MAG TPA: PKD domain-containing protein [Actinomycetales bacterium]|nr:PKD domain-containing protein [Actinomycetales bacterium]
MDATRRVRARRRISVVAVLGLAASFVSAVALAPAAQAAQPKPGHTRLVPDVPRQDTPRISNGEIWDIEVVGNRVFIAGSFTSIADVSGTTAPLGQRYLAAYNIDTGKIDRTFRPTFNGGVNAVEATPDGTKLFVGGTFNTVNGVAAQKVASLNLSTGAPIASFSFSKSTNNGVNALAATNSTLYVGGRFSRINGVLKSGLAAVSTSTGAVDAGFSNDISGGIGVNGALTVQQLKLTHDDSTLLVVHTGRQIAGQDRLGMGLINTATKQLLPWRSRLWDENLARVGGVTRIYAGDIAPDDSYFVVSSGSGGDAPPISDTAIAYPMNPTSGPIDDVQPLWIARNFDSVYSIAITEKAVYIGGHFQWNESPTANQPWPGLDNVGYGTGQGLSGYGLGDQVVRRDHIGALDPATGTALEWNPGSNSFEGNKAMEATARGLFVGGDGMFQGGVRTGRVAFYDFNSLPAPSTTDTTITTPIEGRVVPAGQPFTITGTATNPQGIRRVQVEIKDRNSGQYLQDDGVTWGRSNNIYATLGTGTTNRQWSLPVTVTGNRELQIMAKTYGTNGTNDATKAIKKIESFGLDDQTPTTSINGPSGIQTSTSFTVTGTASDDHGVTSLSYWFRDENNNYLQNDGTVAAVFNTFRGAPDVVGATSATWSYDVTLPHEGVWRASATATDTAGQADLRSATRDITVNSNAVAPSVTITQPVAMTPPFTVPNVVVAPGSPMTFSGTASDDQQLKNVEITLRNNTTRETLGADGTWGVNVSSGRFRISPVNIGASTYNWTYTTPFNLSAGTYSFTVRATDNDDLTTSSTNQGRLTISAQVPGDNPPDGLLTTGTGTLTATAADIPLAGTATDDFGVGSVQLTVFDNDTGRYLQPNGTLSSTYAQLFGTVASPNATSTTWSYPLHLPGKGDYSVTVLAYDTSGQQDSSTTGATVRYKYYPGDAAPTFEAALGQPVDGSAFTEGKIVVTGRAIDDLSIARVEVGVMNSLGQYMSSAGTFTSTTPSWRTAFLNSPGSPGSNFSYTTPVIPDGTYTVYVRPTDNNDQVGELRTSVGVTVTHPANNPPVANATVSCTQNVCSFDGRGSTDENVSALTYSWSYGTTSTGVSMGTGSGPVPVKTFTAAGTFAVTLTVKDEWGSTATTTLSVPITEPSGNVAPVPTLAFNCIALACGTSSAGTTDPNTGDTISYSWSWDDGSLPTTGASASHTYLTTGTYVISLTATDGWGKAATTTKTVVLTEPAGNRAPTVVFSPTCTGLVCVMSSAGTVDPDGDAITYSWDWGDGTAVSTTASPSHTYATAGTRTITLTVRDGWGRTAVTTRQVTVG